MGIVAATNGMTTTGITVFDEALINEFGWSRTELKIRDAVSFWGAALFMPLGGYAIDRFGVKRCAIVGLLLLTCGLFVYSMTQSLSNIYVLHGVFAFSHSLAGTMAMVILVSRHFSERRGLAVGITLAGTSLGGIIFTQFGAYMLVTTGWRGAFQVEAMIPLVFVLAIIVMVTKGGPAKDSTDLAPEDHGMDVLEALKTSAFWGIALSGFITYGSILAIISNLYLFMRDLGTSESMAATALSVLFGVAFMGKLLSGFMSDRISPYRLFPVNMVIMAIGVAALSSMQLSLVWFGIVMVALGWGGMYTLYNYLVIKSFGLLAVGRIGGTVSVMEALGAGAGPLIAAYVFDTTGSYAGAFTGIFVALLGALLLARWVRPLNAKKGLGSYLH